MPRRSHSARSWREAAASTFTDRPVIVSGRVALAYESIRMSGRLTLETSTIAWLRAGRRGLPGGSSISSRTAV